MIRTRKPSKRLTELGGVSYVEFQLARRNVEFARTMPHSPSGDLWAETPIGRISIEVKTTFDQASWHVSRKQNGADVYFLVCMEDGLCFIALAAEMQRALDVASNVFDGVALIRRSDLPPGSLDAWGKIGLHRMPGIMMPTRPTGSRRARTVKKTLASGEVKTYHYPALRVVHPDNRTVSAENQTISSMITTG